MSDTTGLRHDRFARRLHWIVACLLPIQFALGFFAERVGSRHSAETALAWHVQLGILLLGLTLLRVAWRLLRGRSEGG